ncbi:LON peptidase substrate-binding domain-containing protein [Deinococcus sp.]|uniref:LON peptidase substrate-binding domain-containing protein n=1 Tax=Deinococcus sp. TaxID=47478 RepID=UPI003CC62F1A
MSRSPIPLFPLPDLVLFPGLVLPLYIFEPRYRDLLARVRHSSEPFGIVRIVESAELNDHEAPKPLQERVALFGTLAHLRNVTMHEDGTASIVVVGGERFYIQSFETSHTYLSAVIQEDPLALPDGQGEVSAALARRLLDGLLGTRPRDAATLREHAPADPLLLASFAATLLPLSSDQREQALGAADLLDRLEILISFLPRDERALN